MIIVKPEGAPPCCRSEREFLRAVHQLPGVLIANAPVPSSTAPGAFTREVDCILITPAGISTVEVKGLRATGELHTPRMDAWSVVDGPTSVPLMGRPHAQALTHSKYLSSFLKDSGIAPGWIPAVLAIVGEGIRFPEDQQMLLVDNVHVIKGDPTAPEVLRDQITTGAQRQELSVQTVEEILTAFECVETAPSREDLLAQGFRTEEVIAVEVEARRQQVREEYLAALNLDPRGTHAPEPAVDDLDIAAVPSTEDWRITQERHEASSSLDAELCETGAFIDGVAMHRRLVDYATRKGIDLAEIAAAVNSPDEVLGDENDQNLMYCGPSFAVAVRTLDGVAMFYKDLHVAKAERQGATVNGWEITPRAAKQALNQFSISLDALTRIVTAPEERWWVPGTTDVAHARGHFVAVTTGRMGPIQYVVTRAVAVHRATPKPQPTNAEPTDVVADGITVRASAIAWCQRRQVPVESVIRTAQAPQQTWEGHSPNMQVRAGNDNAVLMDVESQTVVAVMTGHEAIEYRDGVSKDGVRISGRCLYLAKRRRVSLDDLVAAHRSATLVAREQGANANVHIGESLAVTVDDATGAVVDFTFAHHARSLIERGELIAVAGEPTPRSAPSQENPSATAEGLVADSVVDSVADSVGSAAVSPLKASPAILARTAPAASLVQGDASTPSSVVSFPRPRPVQVSPSRKAAATPSPLYMAKRRSA